LCCNAGHFYHASVNLSTNPVYPCFWHGASTRSCTLNPFEFRANNDIIFGELPFNYNKRQGRGGDLSLRARNGAIPVLVVAIFRLADDHTYSRSNKFGVSTHFKR